MTAFTEISVITDGEAAEAVAEVLRPFAYQESVVLEQLGDAHSTDPLALEAAVTVKIYVPVEKDTPELRLRIEEILYHMNRLYPIPGPTFRIMEEQDWANAWKEHYHPFRIGRHIWIRPSWYADKAEPSADQAQSSDIILVLDPGMAFGTGLHPTTQSCLIALENIVKQGDTVLDVGTGSGILAIAAAKLGAAAVSAVDTDELAVRATEDNARLNDVSGPVSIWQGDLSTVGKQGWNVVVVNILAPVIIDLLRHGGLLDYLGPDGRLILSGIIDVQAPEVEAALAVAGGRVIERIEQRDWVTVIAQAM